MPHHESKNIHTSISFPSPSTNWFVKIEHVCIYTAGFHFQADVTHHYYNIHPLLIPDTNYNKTYFENLGLGAVGGHFRFSPVRNSDVTHLYTKTSSDTTTHYPGKTILPNCYWQMWNPVHFLFGLSELFEWTISRPSYVPSFERLSLLKCDCWYRALHAWDWAQNVFEAAVGPWVHNEYFIEDSRSESRHPFPYDSTPDHPYYPLPNASEYHPFPHIISPHRRHTDGDHLTCFEELFVTQRWGVFFSSRDMVLKFRESIDRLLYWKKKLKANPHLVYQPELIPNHIDHSDWLTETGQAERCQQKSLKILLQLRPQEYTRQILNLEEVQKSLSTFSTSSTTVRQHAPPLEDQIRVYNSFDVLVTMVGAHLTNLVFTNRTNVGILEIGLDTRDPFHKTNAHVFGIKHYYYQHKNNKPSDECYTQKKVDPRCKPNPTDQMAVICPGTRPEDIWNSIGDCSFTIDIPTFEIQLTKLITNLCTV